MNEWLKWSVSKSNCWLQANAVCSTHLCGTIFPLCPPLLSIRKPLFCETSLHNSWLFVRMILWVLTLPWIFTAFLSMLIFQTSFSFCLMLGCVPPCYLHSRHIPYEKSDSADNSLRSLANYVTVSCHKPWWAGWRDQRSRLVQLWGIPVGSSFWFRLLFFNQGDLLKSVIHSLTLNTSSMATFQFITQDTQSSMAFYTWKTQVFEKLLHWL